MKLRFERGALADLDAIFAYIAQDDRQAAARISARIESVIKRLAEAPYMGAATRNRAFDDFGWQPRDRV